ncbi:MAG: hypothetical protein PF517_16715 [Salinivirgaceae bacterium]|jgi:hypothetical protein|nr:hypothetical protein [Salinivirgaceae bacterium]
MQKISIVILYLILLCDQLNAQYYDTGQDSFSINWKKIETPHFKIIVSDDAMLQGKMYAGYLEAVYKSGGISLSHNPRKIPVIIHNENALSNGEVAWAPKRMNLYAIPPQSGYAEMYSKHLALHEFRHVVQVDKLNQSSTRVLYYLFGEQAIGGVLGWHIPRWFFEGDAVAFETGASNSGRGRFPDFSMKLKAQIDAEGIFSYPKAQFGSFKDFVPSHYELGYQLITRSSEKYGYNMWSSVLDRVAKSPIHINAFSKGIKQKTGLSERKLYEEIMNDFSDEVKHNGDSLKIANNDKDYINYYSPYFNGNSIICYKTSYSDIQHIIAIDSIGIEKIIYTPGHIYDQTFSFNDSVLVWNEYKGTRWENSNYMRIVKYTMKSQEKKYLTQKTKAYHSQLSPDNSKILSVEVDKSLRWSITIRDAVNGALLDSIYFNDQPVEPSWAPNMEEIVFIMVGNDGKSLGILNLVSRKINWIIKDKYLDIAKPTHTGDAIVLKGVFNDASNILSYNIESEKWQALTKVNYGVGEAQVHSGNLVYTDYTYSGYKLRKTVLPSVFSNIIEGPDLYETKQTEFLNETEQQVDFSKIDTAFLVKNYSRAMNLFNIHSWAPLGINIQNIEVGPGVTLMSQNDLSTLSGLGGYQYNLLDQSHKYFADFTYKGFFPILSTNISRTFYRDSVSDQNSNKYFVKYSDLSLQSTVTLPLNFDTGKWYRRIQPSFAYEYSTLISSRENLVQLVSKDIHNFYFQFNALNLLTTSYRDLQSRWGQVLNFRYIRSLDLDYKGQLASGELTMYFPGLIKNHGVKIYSAYQWKEVGERSFSDRITYPYGYTQIHNDEMISLHGHYIFPVLYPDLNIFEGAYIKRLKADIFYQYSEFSYMNSTFDLKSVGGDITADMHLLRFPFPFELGVRYARKIDFNDNFYQFLFSMSF